MGFAIAIITFFINAYDTLFENESITDINYPDLLAPDLGWDSSCLTPRTFVAQTFEAGPLMPVRGCDN